MGGILSPFRLAEIDLGQENHKYFTPIGHIVAIIQSMKELCLEDFQRWGKIGGQIGGKARAKALSPERRSEIARIAGSAPKRKRSKKQ
jgi:hypothetical protein